MTRCSKGIMPTLSAIMVLALVPWSSLYAASANASRIALVIGNGDEPKPRRFLTDTLTYRSVAATSDVDAFSNQRIQCPSEISITVDTTPLQAQGRTQVWIYSVRTGKISLLRGSEYSALFPGTFDVEDGVCEVDGDASWYLMAFTEDTNPRVAEYHEVHFTWQGKALSKPIFKTIPGEIIKGRPACPPKKWGNGFVLLKHKLGECAPEEH